MLFLADIHLAQFTNFRTPLKDRRGGLTPAGRRFYKEKYGSNLRPGVRKKVKDMTREKSQKNGDSLQHRLSRVPTSILK